MARNFDVPVSTPQAEEFLQGVKDVATHAAQAEVERIVGSEDGPTMGPLPDVLTELRRPFAPEAVKWKVQTEWGSGAIVVAHIDARLVIERLNMVVGLNWHDEYAPLGNGLMWCALTVQGVTRRDVGQGADGKTMVSDALKRAGVKFGIGVSIYAMRAVQMERGTGPNKLRTEKRKKKGGSEKVDVCVLDDLNREWLSAAYARWLDKGSGKIFGEPLPHGDEVGAAGLELDIEDAPAPEEAPDVVPVEDALADEIAQTCKDAFDTLRERGEMLPGEFSRRLRAASGSHEDLQALADELVARAAGEAKA